MINMQRPETRSTYSGPPAPAPALTREHSTGTKMTVAPGRRIHETKDETSRRSHRQGTTIPSILVEVVVTQEPTANTFQIHHRDIPELHADGVTPGEAAANLAEDLTREIEGVADHYRRRLFERVLDDVRAFTEVVSLTTHLGQVSAAYRDHPGRVKQSIKLTAILWEQAQSRDFEEALSLASESFRRTIRIALASRKIVRHGVALVDGHRRCE